MKTIILMISLSIFSLSLFSATSIPPFENILKNEINYPEFAKETNTEGTVLVCFSINENGKISIKESNSDNDGLRNYVINKLSNLILPFSGQPDKDVNMKFVFKRL